MSSIIHLLPDHVANQIAAGEVVQRPASVVKELLENAVDAKATDIKLIVKDAGKALVQVIDNGNGMSVTDARMCFERHATSKIRQAEDLFVIHTKGFRGEALASIAAIAHVELKTRQADEELGTHIIIEGSKFIAQDPAVLPKGTSFAVKNLFFNIPARRNFLKSETVEHRHILDEFQRIALAHPTIHFTFIHNGSELYNLPSSNLRQRIVAVFSGKTNEKLIPVSEETEIVKIHGFASKPEFSKKSRSEQFFFVNDRFIKSGYLHHAIMAAYEGLLRDGMQPGYFIFLEVPPNSIDINIHPTKTEIKFDDEQALYAILRATVKHSLGQFNIAPVLDFERDPNLDTPYNYQRKDAAFPLLQMNADFNPFSEEKEVKNAYSSTYRDRKTETASWEGLYVGLKNDMAELDSRTFEQEAISSALFQDVEIEETKHRTYQIHKKYIVSSIKSGLMIVDQQRAHQRILYERYLNNITVKQASSQHLLFPLELYFSTNETQLIQELQTALEHTGFIFDAVYEDKISISGKPVQVKDSEITILFDQLIHDLQFGIPDSSFSQNDTIAKSMARSLAVQTGTYLTEREQENIVNGLFACKDPNVSPFNKPTFITISVEDIDKNFMI
jgi:DNA mismatch repair protein MutL